jgi:hypothetical protein
VINGKHEFSQQRHFITTLTKDQSAAIPTGPGVDVMITIFCDYWQFSAKKLATFSKTNVMIKFLKKTSCSLSKKRQYFR